ncbi:hypothetical protein [Burkholderia cepacia]|uniref:hypothetical protein n=1 Tax=Burkholderia cepacia TaxID=292 RepID=UPI00158A2C5C|nr:hypothetical protein [Burkholderia cepacia]
MKAIWIFFIGVLTLGSEGAALLASPLVQAAEAGTPKAVAEAPAKTTARHGLETQIKKGMTLAAFRHIALAQGWAPIPHTPPCLSQVSPTLCAQLPELYNTSSGPEEYNEVSYRHLLSGEAISVTATGDIGRWNKPGEADEVVIDSWSFTPDDVQN